MHKLKFRNFRMENKLNNNVLKRGDKLQSINQIESDLLSLNIREELLEEQELIKIQNEELPVTRNKCTNWRCESEYGDRH